MYAWGVTPEQEQRRLDARRMHGEGLTIAEIARRLEVSWGTVKSYTQDLGLPDNGTSRSSRAKALQSEQNNQARHAVLVERAFDLVLQGMPIRQVAKEVGRAYPVVRGWITDEIEKRIAPKVEQLREIEAARYGRLRQIAWKIADDEKRPDKIRLEAIDRLLNISRGYRAMMGLDSPVRVEAVYTEVTQEDMEMAELIREAEARNMIIQGEIVDDADAAPE